MAEFELHCFGQSGNAFKVAMMLDLCGADWAPVFVDFFTGETRSAAFREGVSAMGEVPVLRHRGETLTQSGVILDYLAETLGRFGPRDAAERREIWRWILWDNHKFTSYLATYRFQAHLAQPPGKPDVLAFFKARVEANLAILEKHLAGRTFVVGAQPTIADLSLAGYLFYPNSETGLDLETIHPAIAAWTDRLSELPGWRPPYEAMPIRAA